jgi:hypothetical protein
MAPTKSSRPRQIEEESGAGASNFPIGSDHEDDTTNQGSDDAGARALFYLDGVVVLVLWLGF